MQMVDRQSLSDVLFAVVIIVALWAWNAAAYVAIIAAAICYLSIASVRAVASSETMRDVLINRQTEITARRANDNQYRIYRTQQAALPQPDYTPAADGLQSKRFVPAVDPRARVAAAEWIWGLFGDDNRLDPTKVLAAHTKKPGQIQAPKPREDVLALLKDARLVQVGEGGMLFWSAPPTLTVHDALSRIQERTTQE